MNDNLYYIVSIYKSLSVARELLNLQVRTLLIYLNAEKKSAIGQFFEINHSGTLHIRHHDIISTTPDSKAVDLAADARAVNEM